MQRSSAAISAVLVVVALLFFWTSDHHRSSQEVERGFRAQAAQDVQHVKLAGVETIVQLASVGHKGVALLFHGCTHSARSFLIFPEHRRVLQAALEQGFSVVAFTSEDRASGCWDAEADHPRVKAALQELLARYPSWRSLPFVALGTSSGGFFLPSLAEGDMPVDCRALVYVISAPVGFHVPRIPSLFVHMPADTRTARVVAASMGLLRDWGVDTDEIEARALSVTSELLQAAQIPGLTDSAIHSFLDWLQTQGHVNESGMLTGSPRRIRSDVSAFLLRSTGEHPASHAVGSEKGRILVASVMEVLQRAEGSHETPGDLAAQAWHWAANQAAARRG